MAVSLSIRRQVITVCRRLYERGLIAGSDGNVSVRIGKGGSALLITPAGLSKVDVGVDDLVEVPLEGSRVPRSRATRPSTELAMHLRLYRRRSNVGAVVHAHPPFATAFAAADATLPADSLPEMVYQLGKIAHIPFVVPGTEAVADAMEPYINEHDVFLFANHGATTIGATLSSAHQRMESLEHGARIVWLARSLGGARALPASALAALLAARMANSQRTPNDTRSGRS